jgi:hypothetical protein
VHARRVSCIGNASTRPCDKRAITKAAACNHRCFHLTERLQAAAGLGSGNALRPLIPNNRPGGTRGDNRSRPGHRSPSGWEQPVQGHEESDGVDALIRTKPAIARVNSRHPAEKPVHDLPAYVRVNSRHPAEQPVHDLPAYVGVRLRGVGVRLRGVCVTPVAVVLGFVSSANVAVQQTRARRGACCATVSGGSPLGSLLGRTSPPPELAT